MSGPKSYVDSHCVSWAALEKINERRVVHGESMRAAIAFAKAQYAMGQFCFYIGWMLKDVHENGHSNYGYHLDGTVKAAWEEFEKWELCRRVRS